MIPFVHYETESGRIVMSGVAPSLKAVSVQKPMREGCAVLAGDGHWDTHYVRGNEIVPRLANPAVRQGAQLTMVPVPSHLVIGQQRYAIDEPTVDIEIGYPGVYLVRLESFPYLDIAFTLEVAS